MAFLRQLILGVAVLVGTAYLWAAYVPGGARLLDQYGLLAPLGLSVEEEAEAPAARPGGGAGRPQGAGRPEGASQGASGQTAGERSGGRPQAGAQASGAPAAGRPAAGRPAGGRPAGGRFSRGPTRVVVAEVVTATLNDRITAIGDGRALRAVTVRSEATGLITELDIEAGAYVTKDALIARLDDEAERIALERARLLLEDATAEADRLDRLQGTGAVTAVRLREGQLALRTAELAVQQAEFDLSRRMIRAPISGWIGLVDVSEGDRVTPQDTLLSLTDRSELLIDFRVPERVVAQITKGMRFEAAILANEGVVLAGTIDAMDSAVDLSSRTLRVRGRLRNDEDRLRAGMAFLVGLAFEGETYPSVDPLSVQWSGDGSFVWVVRDDKAVRVPVLIRQRNSDSVLVDASLSPGDLVVTEGVQTLRPGASVAVVSGGAVQADASRRADPKQDL